MRECRSWGSVRGVLGDRHPYRDQALEPTHRYCCHIRVKPNGGRTTTSAMGLPRCAPLWIPKQAPCSARPFAATVLRSSASYWISLRKTCPRIWKSISFWTTLRPTRPLPSALAGFGIDLPDASQEIPGQAATLQYLGKLSSHCGENVERAGSRYGRGGAFPNQPCAPIARALSADAGAGNVQRPSKSGGSSRRSETYRQFSSRVL